MMLAIDRPAQPFAAPVVVTRAAKADIGAPALAVNPQGQVLVAGRDARDRVVGSRSGRGAARSGLAAEGEQALVAGARVQRPLDHRGGVLTPAQLRQREREIRTHAECAGVRLEGAGE